MTCRVYSLLALSALQVLASCDAAPSVAPVAPSPVESRQQVVVQTRGEISQRQVAFLSRLREADPQHRTTDRALLNEQNELALIMDRSVEMDKIPALTRTMLAQMASEFRSQDLTVIADTPSTPPRKIGTARLNAQTRDMTYSPEC